MAFLLYWGYKLLFFGQKEVGEVVRCDEMQFRTSGGVGSSNTNRYKIYDYIPIARSSEGVEALGTFILGEEWCKRQVGKSVDILVHPDDVARSRVSSYIQLWLLPVHVLVTLLLIFLSVVKPQLWRYVPAPYFCGLFVFWVAEFYF